MSLENERIDALEIKMSYLEDFMNQIQGVAVEQAKTIDKRKAEIKMMSEKLRDVSDSLEGDIPSRKPPHY